MRKTVALLAVFALLALAAIAYGSPPTKIQKIEKTTVISTVSKDATGVTATARPAQAARTVEAVAINYMQTAPVVGVAKTDNTTVVNRHSASPPERLNSGNTVKDATYERDGAAATSGYVLRL